MSGLSIGVGLSSARKLLEVIGGERRRSENREGWLWRVSQTTGLHYRVVRAIWHGERISFESAFKLKEAAKKHDNYLIERLLWNRAVLREIDPQFYAEEIARIDSLVSRIRDLADPQD